MGVLLRTPDGRVHYASGTWTKEVETVDEQNLMSLVIAWQGGTNTAPFAISTEQWADNKFGFPVEWFVNMVNGLASLANQIKASADGALNAANAAKASADAAKASADACLAAIRNLDLSAMTAALVAAIEAALADATVEVDNAAVARATVDLWRDEVTLRAVTPT